MRLTGPFGRLRFRFSVVLVAGMWVALGSLLPMSATDPTAVAQFFHAWALLALLMEIAVVLRLRDLARAWWWSIPAFLLYPMSAYACWAIQAIGFYEPYALEPHAPFLWRVYTAGAVVVPISLLYLSLAPARHVRSGAVPAAVVDV